MWDAIKTLTNPESIIQYGGIVLLALVIFAETGIFFGFFYREITLFYFREYCVKHTLNGLHCILKQWL